MGNQNGQICSVYAVYIGIIVSGSYTWKNRMKKNKNVIGADENIAFSNDADRRMLQWTSSRGVENWFLYLLSYIFEYYLICIYPGNRYKYIHACG